MPIFGCLYVKVYIYIYISVLYVCVPGEYTEDFMAQLKKYKLNDIVVLVISRKLGMDTFDSE